MNLGTFVTDVIEGLRVVGGAALGLVVPGFALTLALFPRPSLGAATRLLLSIGLSTSAVILGSIVMHWADVSLDLRSWALLLAGVTGAGLVGAATRRASVLRAGDGWSLSRTTLRSALFVAAAGLVAITAVLLSRAPLPARGVQGNTALWLLPAGPGAARVGVSSGELRPKSYRVVITGTSGWSVSRRIRLEPGETWEATLTLLSRHRVERVRARLGGISRNSGHYRLATVTLRPPEGKAGATG